MDRTLLLITVPLMLAAGFALVKGIPVLSAALRQAELANLPLAPAGTVDIPEAGEIVLSLRGAFGSRDFARASFILRDANGQSVPSSMILMRSSRTTLAGETTLAVRRFTLATAGRYYLEVSGLTPADQSSRNRLILSKAAGSSRLLPLVWVAGAAVVLLAAFVFSAIVAFAEPAVRTVSTPAAGSPTRTAILDAVRATLHIPSGRDSRFKVSHLKTTHIWAYFEGNEIVHVDGAEWQETDLTVKALLERRNTEWIVRACWSLPANEQTSLQEFGRQVAELRRRADIPAQIFP
jgi:hypothetical protein